MNPTTSSNISKTPWIYISRVCCLFGCGWVLIGQCVNTHVFLQRLSQSLATRTSVTAWMDLPLSYEAVMHILTPKDTLLGAAMMHRNITTTTTVRRRQSPPQTRVLAATAKQAVTTTTTIAPHSTVDKVRRIHLLGERNSGTNFLNEALVAAFPGYGAGKDQQHFQGGIPVFEYKHMFLHDLLNETQVQELAQASSQSLFLLMVRNPCDWAVAMKKKPWHLCRPDGTDCDRKGTNENAFWNHSLSEFWLEPVRDHGELGTPTNASQPPPVNEGRLLYGNTLQLRAHKLRLMRQVRDTVANVKVVHFRDFEAAPHRVVVELAEEFDLHLSKNYHGLPPSRRLHRQPCLSASDHAVLMEHVDWEMESQFGYFPSDCRVCSGTPMAASLSTHHAMKTRKQPPPVRNGNNLTPSRPVARLSNPGIRPRR